METFELKLTPKWHGGCLKIGKLVKAELSEAIPNSLSDTLLTRLRLRYYGGFKERTVDFEYDNILARGEEIKELAKQTAELWLADELNAMYDA
jgi:hypothetical protein